MCVCVCVCVPLSLSLSLSLVCVCVHVHVCVCVYVCARHVTTKSMSTKRGYEMLILSHYMYAATTLTLLVTVCNVCVFYC